MFVIFGNRKVVDFHIQFVLKKVFNCVIDIQTGFSYTYTVKPLCLPHIISTVEHERDKCLYYSCEELLLGQRNRVIYRSKYSDQWAKSQALFVGHQCFKQKTIYSRE